MVREHLLQLPEDHFVIRLRNRPLLAQRLHEDLRRLRGEDAKVHARAGTLQAR